MKDGVCRLVGHSSASQLGGTSLVAQSALGTYEIIEKSEWEKTP